MLQHNGDLLVVAASSAEMKLELLPRVALKVPSRAAHTDTSTYRCTSLIRDAPIPSPTIMARRSSS